MTYFSNKYKLYLFPLFWILMMAVLQVLGKEYFRYESNLISNAELWRVFTAHWVHLNWIHWMMNSLGLLLLIAILRIRWHAIFWLKLILIHSLFITMAFLIINTHLHWYVGFSGVLYGLYIFAGLTHFQKDKVISSFLLALVVIKILSEQTWGSAISSQMLLGAPVVIDAHAYGVVCGLILGLMWFFKIFKIKSIK